MNLFKKVTDYKSDFTTFPRTFEGYKWYKPILILILGIIFYLIVFSIFDLIVYYFNSIPNMIFPNASQSEMEFIASSLAIILLIPSIYIPSRLLGERPFSSYLSSYKNWRWKVFLKTFLITLLVFGVINIAQILINGIPIDPNFTIMAFIVGIVITPFQCFAEEYLCRGFLMQSVGSWFKIPIIAIILQALIFTVLHDYNFIGLIDIFVTGFIFGLIAWYTKGLEVSTAIHTINNIVVFLCFSFGFAVETTEILIMDIVVSISTLLISVALIYLIDKKYNWIGLKKEED